MANTKSEYIRRTGSRGKSYRRKPAPSIDNGRRSGRKVESKNPSPLPRSFASKRWSISRKVGSLRASVPFHAREEFIFHRKPRAEDAGSRNQGFLPRTNTFGRVENYGVLGGLDRFGAVESFINHSTLLGPISSGSSGPSMTRTPGISGRGSRAVANWRVGQQRFEGHKSRRLAHASTDPSLRIIYIYIYILYIYIYMKLSTYVCVGWERRVIYREQRRREGG